MDVLIAKNQTITPDAVNYIFLIYSFAVEGVKFASELERSVLK